MSLVAWYPLNGTTGNKGLEDAELTWSTSPVFGDSRLVPALTKGGAYLSGVQTAKILKYKFSYCAWIKVTGGSSRIFFGNNSMGSAGNSNNRHYSLYLYPTINDLHWSWQVDATSSAAGKTFAGIFNNFFPTNEWVHLAVTYGDGYFRVYKNGTRVHSETYTGINPSTVSTFAYATNIITNSTGTSYSDIRIYDHVLSYKEVSDIAHGLVCHYKLDSAGGRTGNQNLLKNSWQGEGIFQAWSVTPDIDSNNINNGDGTYSRKFVVHSNPPGWHLTGISSNMLVLSKLKPSTKYTFSFWLKTDYTGNFQFSIIKSNATNLLTNYVYLKSIGDNQWHRYSGVLTTISEDAFNSILGDQIIYIYGLEFTGSYEYKWLKLEEGDEATDWCPNTIDNLYKKLGYSSCIDECSGYLNNTYASSENIKLTKNSIIHNSCFKLDGANTGIIALKAPWEPDTEISECTISIWASTTVVESNYWNFSYNKGLRIRPYYTWSDKSGCSLDIIYYDGTIQRFAAVSGLPADLISGVVHNIVLTWKNGTFKAYVDGEYKGLRTVESSILKPNSSTCVLGSFNGTTECQIGISSDFRIYSTALSDEAIRELYEVRENISNKGDVGALDLIDDTDSIKLGKNGLIHSPIFSELPTYFDNNLYTEPDGSKWIRVVHHSNPATYLFSSADNFTAPFFTDNNRWWNMPFCNYLKNGNWEIMIKQMATSGGDEVKYRWIQYSNPMTATYESVDWNNTERILSEGYTAADDLYGGLYLIKGSYTYICCNNGHLGNWWGSVGAFGHHQGGIPGYSAKVITTGYLDVYVRVDNQLTDTAGLTKATIGKSGICQGRTFIEY